tara:strand:- start:1799 stop:2260 length:462 start_codon:yes stop_codon:yes gene_type:complete
MSRFKKSHYDREFEKKLKKTSEEVPSSGPLVYKTKNCAILSMHFSIHVDGEGDYYAGGGAGVGKVVGRALGEAVGEALAGSLSDEFQSPEMILSDQSVALADAYSALIDEGWIPQSTGFGGAGAGRTIHNHGYIFIQLFTKAKKTYEKISKSK